jgi:hypothetical protein
MLFAAIAMFMIAFLTMGGAPSQTARPAHVSISKLNFLTI